VWLIFSRKNLYFLDIEDEIVERHDDDAFNTHDSLISPRPHEVYTVREAFKLSNTGCEDSCLLKYDAL
jgi:hypothetical protein